MAELQEKTKIHFENMNKKIVSDIKKASSVLKGSIYDGKGS